MTAKISRVIVNTLGLVGRNPKMQLLSGAAQGAAFRIAMAYYEAGCPDYKIDYEAISGISSALWHQHKFVILSTLNEVLPELKKLYQQVEERRLKWEKKSRHAINAKKSQNSHKKVEKQFSDQDKTAQTPNCVIAPPPRKFNEGKSDQFERQRIIKQQQETTGNKLFTDG